MPVVGDLRSCAARARRSAALRRSCNRTVRGRGGWVAGWAAACRRKRCERWRRFRLDILHWQNSEQPGSILQRRDKASLQQVSVISRHRLADVLDDVLKTRLQAVSGRFLVVRRTAAAQTVLPPACSSGTSGTRCEIASPLIADTAESCAASSSSRPVGGVFERDGDSGDGADGRSARSQRFAQHRGRHAAEDYLRLPTTAVDAGGKPQALTIKAGPGISTTNARAPSAPAVPGPGA